VKVLIVNDYGCLSGGAERVALVLRDGLRARGHDARLFASTAMPVTAPNPSDFTCFGTESSARKVLQIVNPMAVRALSKTLAGFRPDVVHVRMFLSQLSPFILPLLREYRSVLHLGSYHTVCPINSRILPDGSECMVIAGHPCHDSGCLSLAGLARTQLQLGAWRRWRTVFSRVIANSEALAVRLARGGLIADRVIRNGTPLVPERASLSSEPTVAYVGRIADRKGVHVLVRAMQQVVGSVPDAKLLIAGGGPDEKRVAALITELGLDGSVRMLGHLSTGRIEQIISPAWITAAPTLVNESFSNSAIESMMRGTAVVATRVGGFAEMIEDGVTGRLVERGNVGQLANAITSCLRDRALCELMGANARRHALAELSADVMVERFLSLYGELSPQSPSRPERIRSVMPQTT
jgi:glycosyltransferase involved in cell wall biosynthesis